MSMTLSSPMFELAEDADFKSERSGGHYNIFYIKPGRGMAVLRQFFPDGEADDMNAVLFSTSGVHGTYTTIEEIEAGLSKYGDDPDFPDGWPDDYCGNELTVLIIHPRLCTLRYGCVEATLADIPFLKKLRATSHKAIAGIGLR